jgi:hypothetical protein
MIGTMPQTLWPSEEGSNVIISVVVA